MSSNIPVVLVRTKYLPAWSIFAILPATISAFILYVLKSSPIPIGAMTGMNGVASRRFTTLGSIPVSYTHLRAHET